MSQNDLLFLVVTLSLVTSLIVMIARFVGSRRRGRGDESDGRAGWWEGPWDDDDRRP
ncbi:MAG: hypothetical protein JF592_02970 [Microbacterium sp.]|uniref:hypothetical protein n=1 Tax=Microbacterium sp. TaxID=51671 RepID=UPI001DBD57C7|nr:hypothetical protein [Microbacterium sp.]MBW8761531.1 hypothetical protein [Microbacterium sp.]